MRKGPITLSNHCKSENKHPRMRRRPQQNNIILLPSREQDTTVKTRGKRMKDLLNRYTEDKRE